MVCERFEPIAFSRMVVVEGVEGMQGEGGEGGVRAPEGVEGVWTFRVY